MEALHVPSEAVEGVATSRHQRDGFSYARLRTQPERLPHRAKCRAA
jgi:hypothetical protein